MNISDLGLGVSTLSCLLFVRPLGLRFDKNGLSYKQTKNKYIFFRLTLRLTQDLLCVFNSHVAFKLGALGYKKCLK